MYLVYLLQFLVQALEPQPANWFKKNRNVWQIKLYWKLHICETVATTYSAPFIGGATFIQKSFFTDSFQLLFAGGVALNYFQL